MVASGRGQVEVIALLLFRSLGLRHAHDHDDGHCSQRHGDPGRDSGSGGSRLREDLHRGLWANYH